MDNWGQVAAALVSGGAMTWAGNAALQWWRSRDDRAKARDDADVRLEEHRDRLTFDLLAAARSEVAAARAEASFLRPLQARLAHFEEALDHIEALLNSDTPEERNAAERRARAFLNRMRRMADAGGTIRNEVQRRDSLNALPDDMRASLDKLDGKEPT